MLVLADYYLPAKAGGGAMRSLQSQIEMIGDECDFWIITRNHDLLDRRAFEGVPGNAWTRVGKARVYYTRAGVSTMLAFWSALKQINPDFVYLGSVVAVWYSIVPILILRLSGWIGSPSRQLVIGPHGQFGGGALKVKALRKRVFLGLSRLIGLHSGVIWHASSAGEAEQIKRWMGTGVSIRIATNVWKQPPAAVQSRAGKHRGSASIVYVSRISPEKNLLGAIRLLSGVSGRVDFSVFGPIHSAGYWAECRRELETLPGNIVSRYGGALSASEVLSAFGQAHLFLFPTPGENFGHVILEALFAGCPVLCSDQTPWGEIADHGAGWIEKLGDPRGFIQRIEQMIDMDAARWLEMSRNARSFVELYARRTDALEENRKLFQLQGSGQ